MSTSPRSISIITTLIETERDVVVARQRASQLAELLGFDQQERTRIATAVSEIARNAYTYAGGGRVEFCVEGEYDPSLVITINDRGPGIARLDEILRGRYTSQTGMGLGLFGARRLMDEFTIDTTAGAGTIVRMGKRISSRGGPLTVQSIGEIATQLANREPHDPIAAVQQQNRELMGALAELGRRQEELSQLNKELEDTNRGVVALYAELDEKAERLRQADEIKSRFLSHMSHEFRTPLSSILALSRLLLDRTDGELSNEQERQVVFIRRSAEDLSELVNDLLDLAKVQAGKTEINVDRFSVDSLFGALRGVMRPLLSSDAVRLEFVPPSSTIVMFSDESKLAQILRNLISNAIKFTEQGEVVVAAESVNDGAWVAFTVTDSGVGIAEEDIELIFEEFGQARNRLQRRVKGTGLGLPLSRRLAELLGGTLTVTSEVGRGSRFRLELPCVYSAEGAASSGHIAASGAVEPRRVLIIDDEVPSRYLMRRLLEEQGCTVIEATSGLDGLALAASERPDLIMLDLVMPGLTGFEVAERLRQNAESSDIPVYIVTSKALTDAERAELSERTVAVIAKDTVSRDIVQGIVRHHPHRQPSQS
jgi:signal transduction histidine kinase/ActR/RegA family two-component response regulator